MAWGAVIAAGAALVGSYVASEGAKDAANTQADAANRANDTQKQMYEQTRADQTPYREAGYSALEQIQNLLKDPSDVTKQPGYQFGMDQGTRALNAGAAARGMNYSGAQAKALTRYGQDYAETKLNESYNRLANVAGLGQVAVSGQNNQNYGNNVSNNMIGVGNARAGASMYQGQTWGNTINQLGALGSRYMNNNTDQYNGSLNGVMGVYGD